MMQQQAAPIQHGGALFNYYRPPTVPTGAARNPRPPIQHTQPHTNVSRVTWLPICIIFECVFLQTKAIVLECENDTNVTKTPMKEAL
jgi:hypothetical protein